MRPKSKRSRQLDTLLIGAAALAIVIIGAIAIGLAPGLVGVVAVVMVIGMVGAHFSGMSDV